AHSALEPCYSWNNTYHPLNGSDQVLGFNPARYPTNIAGFNYFNLGNGFATPPPDPANFYTATVNGTAYRGPFTYPHPLVSRVPSYRESLLYVISNHTGRADWRWKQILTSYYQ